PKETRETQERRMHRTRSVRWKTVPRSEDCARNDEMRGEEERLVGVAAGVEGGGLVERVGDGGAGDEAGAAAEGEVLETPLDEDEDAALELHDVHQVNEQPDKPGGETGNVNAENVGDGGGASDDGHVSLVEVMEARRRCFAGQARGDDFCGETAALDGDLSDTGKGLIFFV